MAKLISLLILVDTSIFIGEERVDLKAASVHDLEPAQAKALLKAEVATDDAIAVAYHSGNLELHAQLVEKAKAKKGAAPDAAAAAAAKASAEAATAAEAVAAAEAARAEAQASADALIAQAEEEQDLVKAEELRAQAAEVLKLAGLAE